MREEDAALQLFHLAPYSPPDAFPDPELALDAPNGLLAAGGERIDDDYVADVELAAAMHDIGKVSIPDSILLKPGKLTPAEFDCMKRHATVGEEALRAVREGRVACVDGHQYFNRPGPRLVESVRILAEILWPDTIDPAHRGSAWIPL